jgi:hypothetical protein
MTHRFDDEWGPEDWDDGDEYAWNDDEEPTVTCPYCRREIHEETVQCPYCQNYISEEDAPGEGKPLWIVITAIICLAAVYGWIVGF